MYSHFTDTTTHLVPFSVTFPSNITISDTTPSNVSFSETTPQNVSLTWTTPQWPNVTWVVDVSNDTTPGGKDHSDPTESIAPVHLPVLLTYFSISLVGVAGNLLVVLAILCLPRLRTVHNIHVINLCAADVLLGLNAFVLVIDAFEQNWAPENGLCGLLSFLTAFPPVAVVGCMLCIARNRHAAIVRGVRVSARGAEGRRAALVVSGAVWAVAMILCLPTLAGWVSSRAGLFCACCIYFVENVIYSLVLTVVVYCLPNVVILLYYCRIFAHVRRSRRRVLEHAGSDAGRGARRLAADVKVAIQFTVLFVVFNTCYLPSTLIFWRASETPGMDSGTRGAVTIVFAVNIVANPICYFCLNAKARREVGRAFSCCWRRGADANTLLEEKSRSERAEEWRPSRPRPDPPSDRSLRTVSEFTPTSSTVTSNATATSHVTSTSHVAAGPASVSGPSVAPCQEGEEPEAPDTSGGRQGAGQGWRRLPLIRRAESLDVNIIGADLPPANLYI